MKIIELWRYPVKSIGGEQVEQSAIGVDGLDGDRQWGIAKADGTTMLTGRREPKLLFASAAVDNGDVVITLPDGTETNSDDDLSRWLGYDVQLLNAGSTGTAQTYEIAGDFENEETSEWFSWNGPTSSFHDSGRTAVSILSTGSMRSWDWRRFRGNVIIDAESETHLVGNKVQAGSAILDALKAIDRCVMVTRPQPAAGDAPALERDLDVLRTINAENATLLGAGCVVAQPGSLAVGDTLSLI